MFELYIMANNFCGVVQMSPGESSSSFIFTPVLGCHISTAMSHKAMGSFDSVPFLIFRIFILPVTSTCSIFDYHIFFILLLLQWKRQVCL